MKKPEPCKCSYHRQLTILYVLLARLFIAKGGITKLLATIFSDRFTVPSLLILLQNTPIKDNHVFLHACKIDTKNYNFPTQLAKDGELPHNFLQASL